MQAFMAGYLFWERPDDIGLLIPCGLAGSVAGYRALAPAGEGVWEKK